MTPRAERLARELLSPYCSDPIQQNIVEWAAVVIDTAITAAQSEARREAYEDAAKDVDSEARAQATSASRSEQLRDWESMVAAQHAGKILRLAASRIRARAADVTKTTGDAK